MTDRRNDRGVNDHGLTCEGSACIGSRRRAISGTETAADLIDGAFSEL